MPDTHLPDLRFGIGQPVPRQEDPILLRGQGRYTDDIHRPGQAYAVFVRSSHAHGRLRGIDTAAARAMPGVLAVLTAADLSGLGPMRCALSFRNRDGSPLINIDRLPFASDKVRYVGDPIAAVVAESRMAARDAAEAVQAEIEPLPAVTEASAAAAAGAPQLYDHVPGNCVLDFHFGDAEKVAAAFARAAHVTRLAVRNSRVVVCPMEPRSAIGEWDGERYTLTLGCQGVFGLRNQMAAIMGVEPARMRILTGQVGGSFGMKASAYPEYAVLLHAARLLGRPVKWTDERSESFLSDAHGRDHEVIAELALDEDGRFLAVRLTGFANMGAWLSPVAPLMGTGNFVKNVQSNYAVPLIEVSTRCMVTNTPPVSAYRGAGRPEGNYFMERLIETAAREMRRDAVALRRLNHIPPEAMPYQAASGSVYDGGDFSALMDAALAAADVAGFPARRAEAAARGKLRGLGIGNFLECTAPPAKEQGGIRFEKDGTVTIITGTLDYGQGHWTPFAQVLHQHLGVPFQAIRLIQGDSDLLVAGGGTGGSKSLMASGAAIVEAAAKVVERAMPLAAEALEAAEADIVFAAGRFMIAGTDRGIGLMELAARHPGALDVTHVFDQAPMAYPNGCHVAEVEVDPETGEARVVAYTTVNDFGVVVNPLLVAGQVHGGVAQGIGQALIERVAYTEDGQPLTGSFMDYGLPRAEDVPAIAVAFHPVPARTNPLGVKGCGEAGCAGSLPAVMNALCDALGVAHIDMPATPEAIWRALNRR
ncbi:MAG: xanthine dehydrogenase family protein molybdopterin-binding subunit [Rhodovarius sp.]|nr:xanthine dehydrogenase family protein molybdopterin-binding subunit [Rhodovarius sp.]